MLNSLVWGYWRELALPCPFLSVTRFTTNEEMVQSSKGLHDCSLLAAALDGLY
jgi:hypothetical protein